ncbi:uncharacterized protein tant [Fopius arisanus]|uniref:Uncharacterized protein tant n=1 Tax=Fopius arisanus TaxID=64838 RepID=A0A9R1TB86_9HYME|nr:PREDICTED: uncharacterized protein LOC105268398 [Fopius arisanus]XP_011306235.1 PREDICTED: uncharacterized protein LOC105268398 [Fopius arisanus]
MMAEMIAEASGIDCSVNLPDVVASMESLTVDSETNGRQNRYSMRKRHPKMTQTTESLNRRCSIKPKKRSYSTMESEGDIREYYLDKTWKKNQNTLETIYEEIDGMSDNSTLVKGRKLRRFITFDPINQKTNEAKMRKRRAKIKRAFGSKIRAKPASVDMTTFIRKLNESKIQKTRCQLQKNINCVNNCV